VKVKISPGMISGTLRAPASKSSMQRVLAAALLHEGETAINNPGSSADDKAALNIIRSLGAEVEEGAVCRIRSGAALKKVSAPTTVHCGESGLSARMFAPIAALSENEIIITGEGSLLNRPMHFFDELFPQLAVSIRSNNGKLPLRIKGPLHPKDITVNGSLSSQFLTGLLFALGDAAVEPVIITVNDLKSKPYIDLTLELMKVFGYDISHEDHRQFFIRPKKDPGEKISYFVEGDWSGAAFLLVGAAVAGEIKISGLRLNSAQADKAIMQVLKECGTGINISEESIEIKKAGLQAFYFDATDSPDLFPPLAALAAYCKGVSVIKGISRLANKESNRAETLKDIFEKMGVSISLSGDEMSVHGGGIITGATVSPHRDHRIAMAATIAALGAEAPVLIEDAAVVNKSYPDFFTDMNTAGALIDIIES